MKACLIIYFVFISYLSFEQQLEDTIYIRPNNHAYGGMGNGSLLSINYERLFVINSSYFMAAGVGIGISEEFTIGNSDHATKSFLMIPHYFSFNFGGKNSFLELGFGGTGAFWKSNGTYTIFPLFGYRFHRPLFNKYTCRIYGSFPLNRGIFKQGDYFFWFFGLSFGTSF
jgi:hypothetical protein